MLEFDGLVFRDSDNDAYCPTCYDMSGLSIRLSPNLRGPHSDHPNSWHCNVCNQMIKPEIVQHYR